MNLLLVFAAVGAVTFVWRLAAFSLPSVPVSPFWEQFLRFVPITVFAALAVSSLYKEPAYLSLKFVALALAGIVVWRTRQFGLSVVLGLIVLWVLLVASPVLP